VGNGGFWPTNWNISGYATNSVRFDANTASLNLGASSTFGKYSSTLGSPRVLQFGAKYVV
jgi:hypothetical protein